MFEGLGLEQHWHPPWLSLKLIMPPKNKAPKLPTDKAGASKAADVIAASADSEAAPALEEPSVTQLRDGSAASPHGCDTPDGNI
jgi:hypothetical protein